jgi:hypothetical protein
MKISDEDRAKLDELNAAVDSAIRERRDWLDAKMVQYSKFKPGDEVYDYNGRFIGNTSSRCLSEFSLLTREQAAELHARKAKELAR